MSDHDQLVLGLDTSTQVQVGLADADSVLISHSYDDPRRHVEQLAPLVHEVMERSGRRLTELTRIIVGVGPGPYTGLRVGIATARTLGLALGVEVRGVCSLDVLAAQWCRGEQPPTQDFMITSDARRREVYWATYAPDGSRQHGPAVALPADLPAFPIGGPGTQVHAELEPAAGAPLRLDAGVMALVGGNLPDAGIEPLYLRNPDASPPGPRKSVLPRVLS